MQEKHLEMVPEMLSLQYKDQTGAKSFQEASAEKERIR